MFKFIDDSRIRSLLQRENMEKKTTFESIEIYYWFFSTKKRALSSEYALWQLQANENFDSFCAASQESVEEIIFDKLRLVFMTWQDWGMLALTRRCVSQYIFSTSSANRCKYTKLLASRKTFP